jgi:hypothetical protein
LDLYHASIFSRPGGMQIFRLMAWMLEDIDEDLRSHMDIKNVNQKALPCVDEQNRSCDLLKRECLS